MNNHAETARETIEKDIKEVVTKMEELLLATGGQAGQKMQSARARVEEVLETAKGRIEDLQKAGAERVEASASAADRFAHQSPWLVAGAAAGVGLLVGWLLRKK
jgi:ElaB/YqjD/DUF883 family membrane-anchored ribosome-binding protein